MPLFAIKSAFGFHDVIWALGLLKKKKPILFQKEDRVPQDKFKNVHIFIWCMRISNSFFIFGLPLPIFFPAP